MNNETNKARTDKILIVDDTPANLQLLTNLLKEQGYLAYPASDGELALEFVRSTPPDLILLDIKMPRMDGYEVCRRLKADDQTRSIPIIFISVLEDECDKVKAFQAGGVDYITKPVRSEEVLARVNTHLELRHAQLELEARNAEIEAACETLEERVRERSSESEQVNHTLQEEINRHTQTLKALRESEAMYRRIVDTANEGVWVIEPDSQTVSVNSRMAEILGYTPEEIVGRLFTDFIFEEDIPDHLHHIENRRQGIGGQYERRLRHRDGRTVWTIASATPLLDEQRRFEGSFAMFTDITERKGAEEALRESRQRLDNIVANSPGVIHRCANDEHWTMEFISAGITQISGYPAEDFLNNRVRTYASIIHPDDRQGVADAVASGLARKEHYEMDYRLVAADGSLRWVHEQGRGVFAAEGQLLCLDGVIFDITAQRETEEALRLSSERLRLATRVASIGIWDWDIVKNELLWDDSMYRLYGIQREDFGAAYDAWISTVHPADRAHAEGEIQAALRGEREYAPEHRIVWPDGSIRHIKAESKTFRDRDGKPLRMIGTNIDITERKAAENELRELNNDFVTVLENTGDFIYLKDRDNRFRFCSQTLANITGHRSWRDMIGKDDFEVFPEETARIYREEEQPIFNEGKPLLNKVDSYFDTQGERCWVTTNKWPVLDDKGAVVGIFGISRDVTELKAAEERLNELNRDLEQRVKDRTRELATSEERMRLFFERQLVGMAITSPEKGWVQVNDKICEMMGYSREELLRLSWAEMTYPDDLAADVTQFERMLRGEIDSYMLEKRFIRKDGSLVFTNLAIGCVRRADRSVDYVLALLEDISERKRAEENIHELNAELLQRAKALEDANKELESFSYSVSHDLRAPLRHIVGFIELLHNRTVAILDDQSRHYMDVIAESTNKMGTLIDDLLSFSRMGRNEIIKSQVDLDDLVKYIIQEFKPETEDRKIQWNISPLPVVTGDQAMLRIVLINLISNALKFTRPREIAQIEIGCEKKDETEEVVIFVHDNGVGFDMNYADKLFGVFQRLHRQEDFEGTGIGLANVRRVISRHGGRTWVEGEVDHGATFYFSLPTSK